MKEGFLKYNLDNDRYGLVIDGQWEYSGFHCGRTMEVLVDGQWIPTRMEYWDDGWYLVDTPYRGNLEFVRARI